MKLIIQIPCYNEAQTLPITLRDLPASLPGITCIETLVIDDGSTDGTAEVAAALGVDHVIRFPNNKGLAAAFCAGLDASLKLGADLIVNTDADNQYQGCEIVRLIQPLLKGEADMVVGDRHGPGVDGFTPFKRFLQTFGSWVVRQASKSDIPDATSGFRAFNREAAMNLTVLSDFTYTLETLIQAGHKNLALAHLPVATNPPLRPSRLFRSNAQYVQRSIATIIRIYAMYQPLHFFMTLGGTMAALGLLVSMRFLFLFFTVSGSGHIQSLIMAAVLLIVGFQIMLIGLMADLIAGQRHISEEALYRLKRLESKHWPNAREAEASGEERLRFR